MIDAAGPRARAMSSAEPTTCGRVGPFVARRALAAAYLRRCVLHVALALAVQERVHERAGRGAYPEGSVDNMDEKSIAAEVAQRFDEEGERARRQLVLIAKLMKAPWLAEVAERAERAINENDAVTKRADGTPRTRGGVLFAVARRAAFELIQNGALAPATFYKTFCWREPKPKERAVPAAASKPQPKAQRKAAPPSPKPPAGRRPFAPPTEVYTVRRAKPQAEGEPRGDRTLLSRRRSP